MRTLLSLDLKLIIKFSDMDILKDFKREKNILVQIKGVDLAMAIERAVRDAVGMGRRLAKYEKEEKRKSIKTVKS